MAQAECRRDYAIGGRKSRAKMRGAGPRWMYTRATRSSRHRRHRRPPNLETRAQRNVSRANAPGWTRYSRGCEKA